MKVAQSCPALYNSMDYTVHEILQARKLEWVAFPFSRGSSWSRNLTGISRIAGGFFTYWAIRETHVCHRVNIKVSCNLRWWKGIRVIALIDTNILSPNVYMLKKKKQTVMVPSSHSFCIQVGRLCFFSLTDVILLLKSLFAEKQPGGCHH